MQPKYKQLFLGLFIGFLALGVLSRIMSPSLRYFCAYMLEEEEKDDRLAQQPVPVEAITAKPEAVYKRLFGIGEIKAKSSVTIKPEFHSPIKIVEILFNEGERVEKDQVLIKFEDSEAKGKFHETKGRFENAKAQFLRAEKLIKTNSISQAEFDKAKGEFEQAKGGFDQATAQLEKTEIKAPFSGRIGIIENFKIGDVVRPDSPLVTLVDDSTIHIDIRIAAKHVDELAEGQKVFFKVSSIDETLEGFLIAIDSIVQVDTRTILVRAEYSNEEGRLKSGMHADAQIVTKTQTNAFVVPEAAHITKGEDTYVFTVDRGKILSRKVILGFNVEDKRVIDSGLKEGEFVVTIASMKLAEGTPVKIKSLDGETQRLKDPQK